MKLIKSRKGYFYKIINKVKIRISKNEFTSLKKKHKIKSNKNNLKLYFYEWYNGNKNCLESTEINTSKYLNLPIYTEKPHNYIDIPINYNCITSVDYLKQKGGYNKSWFEKYYLTAEYRAKDVKNNIIDLHDNSKYLKLIEICKEKLIKQYKLKKYLNNISHDNGFIQKYKLSKNEIIIMFGDIHGSYHTFFRHMLRLERKGIIKYDTKTNEPYLKKNHTLLFLGDIVDRGKHGAEVFLFILYYIINHKNFK